jgi:hypothetical protein
VAGAADAERIANRIVRGGTDSPPSADAVGTADPGRPARTQVLAEPLADAGTDAGTDGGTDGGTDAARAAGAGAADAGVAGAAAGAPGAAGPAGARRRWGAPWSGWTTPPPPGSPAPGPSAATPPPGAPTGAQPGRPSPSGRSPTGLRPAQIQLGWFGRSSRVPPALAIPMIVGAVLAAIPIVFRAPPLVTVFGNADAWDTYHQFGVAFAALPAAVVALALGNGYPPVREGAAGLAFGLGVTNLAQLAYLRQVAPGYLSSGWWLTALGALAVVVTVFGWRGWSAGWAPGRWSAAALAVLTLCVLTFVHSSPYWQRASGNAVAGPVVAVVVAGVLAVATVVTLSSAATFFIAAAAVCVCLIDLAKDHRFGLPSVFAADSAAAAITLFTLGVVCDRIRDRLFLLIARIAVAVTYLRVQIFATVSSPAEVKPLYLVAFIVIAVLATVGARARGPAQPWSPPYGPSPYYQPPYPPGRYGYGRPDDPWRR